MAGRNPATARLWAGTILAAVMALAPLSAAALDETEEMLMRAGDGRTPTARDRELASDLLREWRESEDVSPQAGDPALGRALEAVAGGRRPVGGEAAALVKLSESYRIGREEADASVEPLAPGGGPRGGRRDYAGVAVTVGMGAAVLVLGTAWILVARRRSRARA